MGETVWQWWIDVKHPPAPSGGVRAGRLSDFGPYDTEAEAQEKIAELKDHPRFAVADLVASKSRKL